MPDIAGQINRCTKINTLLEYCTKPFGSLAKESHQYSFIQMKHRYTVGDFCNNVMNIIQQKDVEYSGFFSSDGIGYIKGDTNQTPAIFNSLPLWHYHPQGEEVLSIWDWFVYLQSPVPLTMLLTPRILLIYIDYTGNGKLKLLKFIKKIMNNVQLINTPNLALLNIIKKIEMDYPHLDYNDLFLDKSGITQHRVKLC